MWHMKIISPFLQQHTSFKPLIMPITKLLFTALAIISISCSAQQKENVDVTDVTKITFFNPGVSYEKE